MSPLEADKADVSLIIVQRDDPRREPVRRLIEHHLSYNHELSPPESMHALGVEQLAAPDVTFWTAWQESELLGCGALKELGPKEGEIKSMHTILSHRGKGVGRRILACMIEEAKKRRYNRLNLETGSMADYAPARALYARFGFTECGPFGDYVLDPYSTFMTLDLTRAAAGSPSD